MRAGIEFGSKSWSLDSLRNVESPVSSPEQSKALAVRLMSDVHSLAGLLSKGKLDCFVGFSRDGS